MARVDFLKTVPLFADMPEAELKTLAQDFAQLEFAQGEAIFYQGDPGLVLYVVEKGQVRIFVQGEDGQEVSVALCGPGEVFGELAVIDGLPRSATAIALEDTVVHTLSRDAFREHMRRSPQLTFNFLQVLSVRVRTSTRQMDTLTMLGVSGRLARKLLELAKNHGERSPEGVRINVALTQSDLASFIGATRESLNKALGSFRRQGLILQKEGHIVIVDPEALRQLTS
jgi:CRP/FNR family transcriptional regulator/CRP/FNR family cyclic AMP-dependent transcriptional regulator